MNKLTIIISLFANLALLKASPKVKIMQVLIKSIHFIAGPGLEKFATKKVERLENLTNRIVRAHVTLSNEPTTVAENKSCELLVSLPGEDPYVKKTAASFEDAVSLATEAMEKILRRKKPR